MHDLTTGGEYLQGRLPPLVTPTSSLLLSASSCRLLHHQHILDFPWQSQARRKQLLTNKSILKIMSQSYSFFLHPLLQHCQAAYSLLPSKEDIQDTCRHFLPKLDPNTVRAVTGLFILTVLATGAQASITSGNGLMVSESILIANRERFSSSIVKDVVHYNFGIDSSKIDDIACVELNMVTKSVRWTTHNELCLDVPLYLHYCQVFLEKEYAEEATFVVRHDRRYREVPSGYFTTTAGPFPIREHLGQDLGDALPLAKDLLYGMSRNGDVSIAVTLETRE